MDDGVCGETFAIMCAAAFGAAATAHPALKRTPPTGILIEGRTSKTNVPGCGSRRLLVGVVERRANLAMTLGNVAKLSGSLRLD